MSTERIAIFGTGLIGASIGLALRANGFAGEIVGFDRSAAELDTALAAGAISVIAGDPFEAAVASDVIVLAVPVYGILDWMEKLAPVLKAGQLVTDTGSIKLAIAEKAAALFGREDQAEFLPGHPMAGKENSGAAHADGSLFSGAVWLFTPLKPVESESAMAAEWREWVQRFGTRTVDLDATKHDEVCAWVSHLPQMLSTALTAMFEEKFAGDPDMRGIGGRALREMTRLGASPYSMWRDVAMLNTEPIAAALVTLEQRLANLRENLKTPELRTEFETANRFRRSTAS